MHIVSRFVCLALLISLAALNWACPYLPTYTRDFSRIHFGFESTMKDLCIYWFLDEVTCAPAQIEITGIPGFNGFGPEGRIGTFGINNDFRAGYEFKFGARSMGNDFGYIDFNGNESFDSGDTPMTKIPGGWRIDTGLGGWGIMEGYYFLRLNAGLFDFEGQQQALHTVKVSMSEGNTKVDYYKLLGLRNARVYPWIAVGNDVGIETEATINNPYPWPSQARFSFYNPNGDPFLVGINGQISDRHDFTVDAKSSWSKTYRKTGNLNVGWGLLQSTTPLNGSVVYRTDTPGGVREAGVASTDWANGFVLNAAEGFEAGASSKTAFAIVNPTSAASSVEVICKDGNSNSFDNQFTIVPMGVTARFTGDLCGVPTGTPIRTVYLHSNTDLVVTSIRTDLAGFQSSSLAGDPFRVGSWISSF
jgi:hypothetical protein